MCVGSTPWSASSRWIRLERCRVAQALDRPGQIDAAAPHGANAGAPLWKSALGALDRGSGRLCRTDLRSARNDRRGAPDRHRTPARRVAPDGDRHHRAVEAGRSRDRAALSRGVPDREGRDPRQARPRAPPACGGCPAGAGRSAGSRRGRCRGHRASRVGCDAEGFRRIPARPRQGCAGFPRCDDGSRNGPGRPIRCGWTCARRICARR